MAAKVLCNFAAENKKDKLMSNETTTPTIQSIDILKVLLTSKWERVTEPTKGYTFTEGDFAKDWDSIYVQPSQLSYQTVDKPMRKLSTPTLLITTKCARMAFILASKEDPVYLTSEFKKTKEYGYILAYRITPLVLPEYFYYMCLFDEWKRIVDRVDAESIYCSESGWNIIGEDVGDGDIITPESILRGAGRIDIPSIQAQKDMIAATKDQEELFTSVKQSSSEAISEILNKYRLLGANLLNQGNVSIGLLLELYKRAAKASVNPKVLEILSTRFNYKPGILSDGELHMLQSNFAEVFSQIVNPAEYSWTNSASYLQPKEVTDFLVQLADFPKGVTVYNPFAGLASYGISLPDNKVVGEELEATTWAIAQIRIFATSADTHITCGDSFIGLDSTEKYDAIISSPVYLKEKGHEIHDIVNHLYDKLSNHGQMLCLVPLSYFFSKHSPIRESRERLISQRAIKGVIALPVNIFPGTRVLQGVIILSKGDANERIIFADASAYTRFAKSVYRMTTFEGAQFLKDLSDEIEDYFDRGEEIDTSTVGAPILYEQLIGNELTPQLYLVPQPKDGIALSELADELPAHHASNSQIDFFITSSSIPESMHQKPYVLSRSKEGVNITTARMQVQLPAEAVIVAINPLGIRTVYTENTRGIVAYPYGVVKILHPKEGISAKYLAALLSLKVVADQFKAQSAGSALPKFDRIDITRIIVPRHKSLEEREHVISEVISSEMSELESEFQENFEKQKREIRSTRHAMIQTLSALSSNWEQLNLFAERQDGRLIFTDTIGQINPISVRDLMGTIGHAISTLERQVESLRFERIDWGKDVEINPYEFINSYINRHVTPSVKMLNVGDENSANFPWYDEEIGKSGIEHTNAAFVFYAPEKLLERIFNNIVANAYAHGFKGKGSNDNEIRFDWESDEGNIVITIANNGRPLKKGVSGEDVLMSGFTTSLNEDASDGTLHSGQGGFEIKSLMEGLGSVEVISNPESNFPVIYKLIFEKTNFETIDLKD